MKIIKISAFMVLALGFFPKNTMALPEFVNNIGVNAGLGYGYGIGTNAKRTIISRYLNSWDLHAMPGYKLGNVMPGLFFEYRWAFQARSASEIDGINLKGNGWLLGPGMTLQFPFMPKLSTLLSVDLLGQYFLAKQTSAKLDSVYSAPFGFHLMFQYKVFKEFAANLAGQWTQYSVSKEGEDSSDIGSNKAREYAVRLGVAYQY